MCLYVCDQYFFLPANGVELKLLIEDFIHKHLKLGPLFWDFQSFSADRRHLGNDDEIDDKKGKTTPKKTNTTNTVSFFFLS